MRGGRQHNDLLAAPIVDALDRLGMPTETEYPVGPGRGAGAVDIATWLPVGLVVIEVELTPARIANDVRKAGRLGATKLLIVTPNPGVTKSIQRRLTRIQVPNRLGVWVRPFGPALSLLSQWSMSRKSRDP